MPDDPAALPPGAAASFTALRLQQPPDLLALHAADPERFFCLLQSSGALSPRTGRYDILFADPLWFCSSRAGSAEADALIAALRHPPSPRDSHAEAASLPFVGGHVFHLNYEAAGHFEPGLDLPAATAAPPDIAVWRVPAAIIHDHHRAQSWAVAEDAPHARRLQAEMRKSRPPVSVPARALGGWQVDPPERFREGVARVLDYLRAGDALQVNLSRAWRLTLREPVSAAQLHAALHRRNPAPFSALLRVGEGSLISASPERLLRIDGACAETRPIAGTRRRGSDAGEDAALMAELSANLKERAEHTMLIDLERNDLGRICRPGSVTVDELLTLEHYATVHHLVSNVRGALSPGVQPGEALAALFPGGTITGCPKYRVMQIIAELEGEGRGAYTGSLGYCSQHGVLDSNILIRTLYQQGDTLHLRAGAGIVADSDPDAELAETEAKARGLLRALEG